LSRLAGCPDITTPMTTTATTIRVVDVFGRYYWTSFVPIATTLPTFMMQQ